MDNLAAELEVLEIPKEPCLILFRRKEWWEAAPEPIVAALRQAGFNKGSQVIFLAPDDELTLLTDERLAELGLQRRGA